MVDLNQKVGAGKSTRWIIVACFIACFISMLILFGTAVSHFTSSSIAQWLYVGAFISVLMLYCLYAVCRSCQRG